MISEFIDSVETSEGNRIVKFSSEICSNNLAKKNIFDAIFYDFNELKSLTLDFSKTNYLNSSGIELLLEAIRTYGKQKNKNIISCNLLIDAKLRIYAILKPMVLTLAKNLNLDNFQVTDSRG